MDWRKKARKALREYPKAKKRGADADQAVVNAVERALAMQDIYPNAEARMYAHMREVEKNET